MLINVLRNYKKQFLLLLFLILITFNIGIFSNTLKYNYTTDTFLDNTIDLFDLKYNAPEININSGTIKCNKMCVGQTKMVGAESWGGKMAMREQFATVVERYYFCHDFFAYFLHLGRK